MHNSAHDLGQDKVDTNTDNSCHTSAHTIDYSRVRALVADAAHGVASTLVHQDRN